MAYTNNVPQGNQQIATTQPIIQANFGFLQTGIGVEHNFNAAGSGSDMYHLKASMPNQALSPALPAGTNGTYFVSSGSPVFYDGTTNWTLNCWQTVVSGTYTPTSSYNTIYTLPASVQGIIIFTTRAGGVNGVSQMGTFLTSANSCYACSCRMKINGTADDYPIELQNYNNGSLKLQGRYFSSSYGVLYTYKIFYRPS